MKNLTLLIAILFLYTSSLIAEELCQDMVMSPIEKITLYRCLDASLHAPDHPDNPDTIILNKLCKMDFGDKGELCPHKGYCPEHRECRRSGNATFKNYGTIEELEVAGENECSEDGKSKCENPGERCYKFTIFAPGGVICPCSCCLKKKSTKIGDRRSGICTADSCYECGDSNLVDLDNFIAIPKKEGIFLNWKTSTEINSSGFHIWRGTPNLEKYCGCSTDINDYKQITVITPDEKNESSLISAKGNEMFGAEYSYLDKDVKPGIPYCYGLEEIDSNGKSKFYFEYISFTPDN